MEVTRRDALAALMAAAAMVGLPRIGHADIPEIVIGNPNCLTGGFGEGGQRSTWGLLIAADEVNRRGGIKSLGGAKLKVIPVDTTSDAPAQAASVTKRLINQNGAVALYGATASAMTLAAQIEAEKSRIPLVTNSYVDALVERGMKYTFKITVKGSRIWNFAFDSVVEIMTAINGAPPKSVVIFMGSDATDQAVARTLPIEAKRLGISIASQVNFQGGLTDPSVLVVPARSNKPDLILFGGFLNDAVSRVPSDKTSPPGQRRPAHRAGWKGHGTAGRPAVAARIPR
jgi:branched-chain amino acid transport system substrate-binding protein